MNIGIDVMGGDYAPYAIIEGAVDSLKHLSPDDTLVLLGDESSILRKLDEMKISSSFFRIVPTTEVIAMGDHPAKAFSQKRDSSIAIGFGMLKNKSLDGFCSAGNTGAMLVGASYTVNVIPGVFRPALATILPCIDGRDSVILDVGLNPDSKPDVLLQYGILGSIYANFVLGKKDPTVGLLNIGLNFKGNVEGHALFHEDITDVVVCDGFVGNIVLKQAESIYSISKKLNISHPFFDRLNFENIGGTPIVGINANVVIGHGISERKAIMNMVLQTRAVVRANLAQKIIEAI
jgi:glycerol-3-phosphate acyltransferase PlsX